jgi:hypothetical protein
LLFQQTDRAAPPKMVALAEMENVVEDIEEDDVTAIKEDVPIIDSSRPPTITPAFRIHRDSYRDGITTELEPIEEQAERSDFSPQPSKSPLDAEE